MDGPGCGQDKMATVGRFWLAEAINQSGSKDLGSGGVMIRVACGHPFFGRWVRGSAHFAGLCVPSFITRVICTEAVEFAALWSLSKDNFGLSQT
ncbi:uncharacterized [Tachysurus ichikawai]